MARIAKPTPELIVQAARRLREGAIVAFPTETVYGLGADTFDVTALNAVFDLKGRAADNPLIAHVADVSGARRLVENWDDRCDALAERFWPGPLTLVLPRRPDVPERSTGGRETIAVRCPRHPVAQDLLDAFGSSISAPSANRSGHISPTSAQHVADDYVDMGHLLVLDGGLCEIGLESTVLDMTALKPRMLRPGSVTSTELREIVPEVLVPTIERQEASPGTALRHYAPRTPADLVEPEQVTQHLLELDEPAVVLGFSARSVLPPHRSIEMPQGAGDYAKRLYDALREADAAGCARIVIESPPTTNEMWKAIHDRLRRAVAR
jgi:L-threonylcarbamoyladenylate synthase